MHRRYLSRRISLTYHSHLLLLLSHFSGPNPFITAASRNICIKPHPIPLTISNSPKKSILQSQAPFSSPSLTTTVIQIGLAPLTGSPGFRVQNSLLPQSIQRAYAGQTQGKRRADAGQTEPFPPTRLVVLQIIPPTSHMPAAT